MPCAPSTLAAVIDMSMSPMENTRGHNIRRLPLRDFATVAHAVPALFEAGHATQLAVADDVRVTAHWSHGRANATVLRPWQAWTGCSLDVTRDLLKKSPPIMRRARARDGSAQGVGTAAVKAYDVPTGDCASLVAHSRVAR